MTKYVVVTTVSTFRGRYVIPLDDLQAENPNVPVQPEWALDVVTCEEANPFSSEHLGELIVDSAVVSEDYVLALFNSDNKYLEDWTEEQKIAHIRNWKASI